MIATATAKQPGRRYDTCAELIAAARGALAGQGRAGGRGRRRLLAAGVVAAAAIAAAAVALLAGR